MNAWLSIFLLTFGFLMLALFGMAIGWIITGRSRMHKRCGSKPGKQDADCGTSSSCELCDPSLGDKSDKRMPRKSIDDD